MPRRDRPLLTQSWGMERRRIGGLRQFATLATLLVAAWAGGSAIPLGATSNTGATTTTTTTALTGHRLVPGDSGPAVRVLQRELTSLHYWVGPINGYFGDSTEQAVFALQKAADIARDGIVGSKTREALLHGVVPTPRAQKGYGIQVKLNDDLLMFVRNGKLEWTLNTSTGGGYTYGDGEIADTPIGHFRIFREVDGLVVDNLGALWLPKYFYTGFAIHGDSYVPAYPVSHGCVRVSNEAIDWVWANNLAPVGTAVWIYK